MLSEKALAVLFINLISSERKLIVLSQKYCKDEIGDNYARRLASQMNRLNHPSLMLDGAGLMPYEFADQCKEIYVDELVDPGDDIENDSISVSSIQVSSSVYGSLKRLIQVNEKGTILIFNAHRLQDDTATLIDKLAQTARKLDLDWRFILVARSERLKQALPHRFLRAEKVPGVSAAKQSSGRRASGQVNNRGSSSRSETSANRISNPISKNNIQWLIGAPVCLILLATILWFTFGSYSVGGKAESGTQSISFNPETTDDISQTDSAAKPETSAVETIDTTQAESGFERRLREWETFNQAADATSENTSPLPALSGVKRMPLEVVAWFETKNSAALLNWFDSNDPNIADENGKSPLLYASILGDAELVDKLLSKGAKVDQSSKFFKTPLMAATHNGHYQICETLLQNGANPDLQDHSGWTALFYATWNRDAALQQLLLRHGADDSIKDSQGLDVAQVARSRES